MKLNLNNFIHYYHNEKERICVAVLSKENIREILIKFFNQIYPGAFWPILDDFLMENNYKLTSRATCSEEDADKYDLSTGERIAYIKMYVKLQVMIYRFTIYVEERIKNTLDMTRAISEKQFEIVEKANVDYLEEITTY